MLTINGFLEAAILYRERGWTPIPLAGKKPIVKWERFQTEQPTEEQIIDWWGGDNPPNIGLVTGPLSGLLVLDVDSQEGEDFLSSKGLLPPTPTVKTSKGRHLYFIYPAGEDLHNFVRKCPGLDLRAAGGYVCAPPSIHPDTLQPYTWTTSPEAVPLAPTPKWLIDLVNAPSPHSLEGERLDVSSILDGIPAGERDDALFKYACSLRARNVKREESLVLVEIAASNCTPPFSLELARSKVEAAYSNYPAGGKETPPPTPPAAPPKWVSMRELHGMTFPPTTWTVPNLIPKGLVFLAGRPKLGKSILGLQLAKAVSTGEDFLGYPLEKRGRVLVVALEDNLKRLQTRTNRLEIPPHAAIAFATSLLNSLLAPEGMTYILHLMDTPGLSLMLMDPLNRCIPAADHNDMKAMGSFIGPLQSAALEKDVTLLIIDHHVKPVAGGTGDPIDSILGSTFKSAAADSAMGFYRKEGDRRNLRVVGRDLEGETSLALEWSATSYGWTCLGQAAQVLRTETEESALAALRKLGGKAASNDLREELNVTRQRLQLVMDPLVQNGQVIASKKAGESTTYSLPLPSTPLPPNAIDGVDTPPGIKAQCALEGVNSKYTPAIDGVDTPPTEPSTPSIASTASIPSTPSTPLFTSIDTSMDISIDDPSMKQMDKDDRPR